MIPCILSFRELQLAPMLFLSGAWTPPEAMPTWMSTLMRISPLHYFIDAGYSILLKGNGIDLIWQSLVGIFVLGSVNFALGLWRFRHQYG